MNNYTLFDFSNLEVKKTMNLLCVKTEIEKYLIISGRFNPTYGRISFIQNRNLFEVYSNIYFYTNFLDNGCSFLERVYCIMNDIIQYNVCKCGEQIKKLTHKNSITKWYYNKYCSQSCANRHSNYNKTEKFYKNVGQKIKDTRIRNGTYKLTEEHIKKLKIAANNDDVKKKKRKTCLERYGIENPGVLGAYSSKAATNFIRNYINENNINEKNCYYKGGGINDKEYFQMIFDDKKNKHIYVSYDLVILDQEKNIDIVLEYNGPWHYTLCEVNLDPNGNATPYPNSKSKREVYEFDMKKYKHISKKAKTILIFWEKGSKLENVLI